MNQIVEQLKTRILEIQKEIESLQADLKGYETALAAELRRNGKVTESPELASEPRPNSESSLLEAQVKNTKNTVRFIEWFIQHKGLAGATHKEVRSALVQGHAGVHPNYHYHVIAKLKQTGKVEEKHGKLYWKESQAAK